MSCKQIACPRQAPPRRLLSRLGRPAGWSAGTALSNFAVSHRLSPLKVSAFFKRTLRPPAPPGGVFLHKVSHICSLFFVQTGELLHKLPAPPQFVAFFCNKPPHFPLWVKGLFHTHPHYTIVNHRISIPNSPCRGTQPGVTQPEKNVCLKPACINSSGGPVGAYARALCGGVCPPEQGGYLPPLGADPGFCTERLLRAGPGPIRMLSASTPARLTSRRNRNPFFPSPPYTPPAP